ncbi:sigma-54 interaction domain-containing protein [Caldanaerobacter subterraneus]|uniref:Sigma 54-interacting transcriptional regulator n=1 Tax=Caldanaerobacter subterraneus TaxID=911092 RepID=A0A7Y2L5K4_9THEO|nr:sigma 54-interacting transcriptional regulator [Caldanaerobacter subterraneus]NNG66092.1 sigma 54-interacting transcriptional regulator [Caldanaerobacter subterraneus]
MKSILNSFKKLLKETFDITTELPKECLSFIPIFQEYYVIIPPCNSKCPNSEKCPYSLILAFKAKGETMTFAFPKKEENRYYFSPAAIANFLVFIVKALNLLKEDLEKFIITKESLQFLAKQADIEFFLFDSSGKLITSQSKEVISFSPSSIFEKISKQLESKNTISTEWGNFHYQLWKDEKQQEGILLWKISNTPKQNLEFNSTKEIFFSIPGKNSRIVEIKNIIHQIASTDSTVLLQGESGTGKELFARYIHYLSSRKNKPFIAINCAAIPESLLESELFGYEEGAFTGARRGGKPGKFELADEGTLFLDEIGDMPLHLQAKLLRVIERQEVERVGSTKARPINVRIIAATNKDLKKLIAAKLFREDLFFRLSVVPITLPALRERSEDIPLLLNFYLKKICLEQGKSFKIFSSDSLEILRNYYWPGNIRELKNVVTYSVSVCEDDVITPEFLPKYLQPSCLQKSIKNSAMRTFPPPQNQLKEELEILLNRYGSSTESKKLVAQQLGISLATLYRWLKKYNLS